jgi:hypothetical protein
MLESPESAARSRNLRFDLDRELSGWLARLEHATNHTDAVQLAKLGTRYSLDPGEACGRGAIRILDGYGRPAMEYLLLRMAHGGLVKWH